MIMFDTPTHSYGVDTYQITIFDKEQKSCEVIRCEGVIIKHLVLGDAAKIEYLLFDDHIKNLCTSNVTMVHPNDELHETYGNKKSDFEVVLNKNNYRFLAFTQEHAKHLARIYGN